MDKNKKTLLVTIPILFIAFIILGCGGSGLSNNNSSNGNNSSSSNNNSNQKTYELPDSIIECDVRDLIDDLDNNPLKASEKYKNNYLKVKGYLSNVDSSGKYFNLDAGSKTFDLTNLQFYIKTDDVKNVIIDCNKRDLLEVTCLCSDVGEFLGYSFYAIKVDKIESEEIDNTISHKDEISEAEVDDDSSASLGQKNALASAKDHLKYSFYSKQYLIETLKYDEYTEDEINYAIEKLDNSVDWNEQAVGSAKEHLQYSYYSITYLKDTLKYDGYTDEEIEYAIETIKDEVDWNEQALEAAREHLEYSAYSKNYLRDTLGYDGYTTDEIDYAINKIDSEVDWNEQAAESAKDHLKYSEYSKSELLEMLKYDGFTDEQAQYGVKQAGF